MTPGGQFRDAVRLLLDDAADLLGLLTHGAGEVGDQLGPPDGQVAVNVHDPLQVLEVAGHRLLLTGIDRAFTTPPA